MKRCFKCGRRKPVEQFYKHPFTADGRLGKCKACTKEDVKRRYYDPAFRPTIEAYERARSKDPERRKKRLEYQRKARSSAPGKARARNRVWTAMRSGLLVRRPCEVCKTKKVEAHHTDYRKPLEIKWLCRKHHLLAEGKVPFTN